MAIRDKTTTNGGGRAYKMVRSKISKGKDGYGKMVTREREAMMQKLGYDPGEDVVAMHKKGGSHFSDKLEAYSKGTRAKNTADSNKARAKKRKLSEKVNDRRKSKD